MKVCGNSQGKNNKQFTFYIITREIITFLNYNTANYFYHTTYKDICTKVKRTIMRQGRLCNINIKQVLMLNIKKRELFFTNCLIEVQLIIIGK